MLFCCILDVFLSFFFCLHRIVNTCLRYDILYVGSYVGYFFRRLYIYIYIYLKSLNNLHKKLYINFQTLRPSSVEVYYIYMKNKQHDVTMEIKEFMTLISRNFVYGKSMSIQFHVTVSQTETVTKFTEKLRNHFG